MTKLINAQIVFACLLASTVLPSFSDAEAFGQAGSAPSGVDQAVGAGRWQSAHDDTGKRDWQVQIERFDDNSIAGSLIVVGSPYLHKARLEGRVDGKEVYGVLVGDGNQQIGTFVGTIAETGLTGTYTTNQGDSGSWSWVGPAAARTLKEDITEIGDGAAPVN